eukprot:GGOE01022072.1.p3 GENE.GGOE01022072.1~~GGOE01022072.1.p3  ORF type:complete len:194 (+),score=15.97 GGOE01022072.1:336-917(+)
MERRRHPKRIVFVDGLVPLFSLEHCLRHHPQRAVFVSSGNCASAAEYCSCLEAWYRLEHPDLVADSTPSAAAQQATAGLHVDRTACDTLTNFTTMAALFSSRHCVHCAVVTDDHHMRRALWCGSVVLGAQGIFISEAVRIHSDDAVVSPGAKSESPWRAIRDLVRAVFWVLTSPVPGGPFTFEWVTHRVHPDR